MRKDAGMPRMGAPQAGSCARAVSRQQGWAGSMRSQIRARTLVAHLPAGGDLLLRGCHGGQAGHATPAPVRSLHHPAPCTSPKHVRRLFWQCNAGSSNLVRHAKHRAAHRVGELALPSNLVTMSSLRICKNKHGTKRHACYCRCLLMHLLKHPWTLLHLVDMKLPAPVGRNSAMGLQTGDGMRTCRMKTPLLANARPSPTKEDLAWVPPASDGMGMWASNARLPAPQTGACCACARDLSAAAAASLGLCRELPSPPAPFPRGSSSLGPASPC